MTSPATPSLPDALRACIEAFAVATPGAWEWSENGNILGHMPDDYDETREVAAVYTERDDGLAPKDAVAILAAENLIRQHGPALDALLRERPAPAFDMEAAVEAAIVGSCPPDESFLEHDEYVRNVLTAALPHLPVYREFGADGKPFCRRSWNEGREAGIAAVAEAKESLQPDMEALRRDAKRYRFLRTPTAALRRIGRVNLMVGNFDEDLDTTIDAALAAQRDTSEGGMER